MTRPRSFMEPAPSSATTARTSSRDSASVSMEGRYSPTIRSSASIFATSSVFPSFWYSAIESLSFFAYDWKARIASGSGSVVMETSFFFSSRTWLRSMRSVSRRTLSPPFKAAFMSSFRRSSSIGCQYTRMLTEGGKAAKLPHSNPIPSVFRRNIMIRLFVRAALAASLAAAFTVSVARIALAVDERAWIALEAGADLYDAEQALSDGAGFGLRATGFLNRWVGVDALYHHASPHQEPTTLGSATFSHYGAGLILTPQRTAWALPYIYGGIGQAKVERDGFSSKSSSAFHGGLGAVFRAGERIGFRLDLRDVTWKQEDGPGRPMRVNEFYVSSGVTAFWLGRARDTDGDKVFDGLDKCASTPAGATVDATGCPLDADGDGVYDGIDKCNDTTKGVLVDAQGCPLDSDGD